MKISYSIVVALIFSLFVALIVFMIGMALVRESQKTKESIKICTSHNMESFVPYKSGVLCIREDGTLVHPDKLSHK